MGHFAVTRIGLALYTLYNIDSAILACKTLSLALASAVPFPDRAISQDAKHCEDEKELQ